MKPEYVYILSIRDINSIYIFYNLEIAKTKAIDLIVVQGKYSRKEIEWETSMFLVPIDDPMNILGVIEKIKVEDFDLG